MKAPVKKPVLTAAEAAEFIGLHYLTVLKYAKNGTLPAKRIGKRYFIVLESLLRWMDTKENDV